MFVSVIDDALISVRVLNLGAFFLPLLVFVVGVQVSLKVLQRAQVEHPVFNGSQHASLIAISVLITFFLNSLFKAVNHNGDLDRPEEEKEKDHCKRHP
jgi:divalent metal cation (Fe/Co/Zn/Cd) transporter